MIQQAMEALKQVVALSTKYAGKLWKCAEGGGRKPKVPENRMEISQLFIDMSTALKIGFHWNSFSCAKLISSKSRKVKQ